MRSQSDLSYPQRSRQKGIHFGKRKENDQKTVRLETEKGQQKSVGEEKAVQSLKVITKKRFHGLLMLEEEDHKFTVVGQGKHSCC